MAEAAAAGWEQALAAWLSPFLEALGHKVRQRWAPVLSVRGLLGPGERKSVQPRAARVAPADGDQLPHVISSPAWRTAPLAAGLAREADRLVGGPDAALIIDDTALPKKGEHSAGVARHYAGVLGKAANSLMFVVDPFGRERAASAKLAEPSYVWLLRSAGGRAAETTASRL